MYTFDHEMANNAYAERLRQAEHERLVQRLLANQPTVYAQGLEKLGDLLITVGMNLKTKLQERYV